ncbi:MAG: hypothetical protein IT210_18010 [Armatimonadetes bacterium]|nr:hypothetical protein [Armatimonadota bacterium]
MDSKSATRERTGRREAKETFLRSAVTGRAILLGLLLVVPDCYWIMQSERVRQGPYVTSISLFAHVIFLLLLLLPVNALVKRLAPRLAFTQGEMLTLYVILSVASAICGMDMAQALMQIIAHVAYFATSANKWDYLLKPILPKWLLVQDKEALTGYFIGNSTLYTPEHARAWIGPSLWWVAFIAVLLWVMACINVIFKRQWVDRERLTYPIVQLPYEMMEATGSLFRNRLMWIGFGLAAGVSILNGLHTLLPSFPSVPIAQYDLQLYVTTKPWNAIGWTPMYFYPFVIGMGFLLPVDLLFSCWFFYIFWKMQKIVSNAAAWDATPEFPFISNQVFGACIGLFIALMWTGRGYLKQVWRAVLGRPGELTGIRGEAMSYRAAFVGLALGLAALIVFSLAAGMSLSMALLFFVAYLIISFVVTRIRAELGSPVHDFHTMGPDLMLTSAMGSRSIAGKDLGMLAVYWWFNRAYRSHPMPHQMEALKLADRARLDARRMLLAMMLAALVGAAASIWVYIHLGYRLGTSAKFWSGYGYGYEIYNRLQGWVESPTAPNAQANIATLLGVLFSIFLMAMRARFFWWPFHPIGYAISGSWSINLVWVPLFISWLLKLTVLRYGGLAAYRRALPFFFGLILGECALGPLWSAVGIILGVPTYNFWGG